MALSMAWFSHAAVAGGSKIDINADKIGLGLKVFVRGDQVPGKDMSTAWNTKLAEVDFCGFENPVYTIQGNLISGVSTNSAGSVLMNLGQLGSFATLGSPIAFQSPNTILNSTGSALILIRDFKIDEYINSDNVLSYGMTVQETKVW